MCYTQAIVRQSVMPDARGAPTGAMNTTPAHRRSVVSAMRMCYEHLGEMREDLLDDIDSVAYLRYAGSVAHVIHHTALRLYAVHCTACVKPLRGFEPISKQNPQKIFSFFVFSQP